MCIRDRQKPTETDRHFDEFTEKPTEPTIIFGSHPPQLQKNDGHRPTFSVKNEKLIEPFLFSVYLRFTINPGRHMVTRALEPLKCCLFSWFHRETHRETEREELFFGFVFFGLKTKNPTETDRHFGETMADRAVCTGESNKRTSWNKVG